MSELILPSWLETRRPALALVAIVGGNVAFNSAALRMLYNTSDNEYFMSFIVGAFAFQGLSFGIWLAMGPGPFLMRLPFVIVAVCMVASALGLVSTSIERMDRFQFIAILLAAYAISLASTIIFLIAPWFVQRRIALEGSLQTGGRAKVRFSMLYLLGLTTAVALALGMVSLMRFKTPESNPYFGPKFAIFVTTVGGLVVSGVVLPTTVVPLFLLLGRVSNREFRRAIGFWLVVTVGAALYWALEDNQSFPELVLVILMTQLGAALAGACAAIALRLGGFRFAKISVEKPISNPLPSNV